MTNKKLGNSFENQFVEILSKEGFWCHLFAQNQAGQPADVIAAKNGKAYLIDCKVCSGKGFSFSRVEDNQHLSMRLWKDCGNGDGWFALLFDEQVYMIKHEVLIELKVFMASMNESHIRRWCIPLEKWIEKCE